MLKRLSDSIKNYEFELLNEIGFNIEIPLAYPFIRNFIFPINISSDLRKTIIRYANNFANDSFRTNLCLYKGPENIAIACVFLAVKYVKFEMQIDADQETIGVIQNLYRHH